MMGEPRIRIGEWSWRFGSYCFLRAILTGDPGPKKVERRSTKWSVEEPDVL